MPNRTRRLDAATQRGRQQLMEIGRELRVARVNRGMRLADVAGAVGTSVARLSLIERGLVLTVSHLLLIRIAATVGHRLASRLFPSERHLLDAPQLALFGRLRSRAHRAWSWRTEVGMPLPGDLRAADAVAIVPGCTVMAELFVRLSDFQAQSRSALLKKRDLGADRLLLVFADSHANRRALRDLGDAAAHSFPVPARAALAALKAGRDPGGDAIVLV